jgi:hypothetical protein
LKIDLNGAIGLGYALVSIATYLISPWLKSTSDRAKIAVAGVTLEYLKSSNKWIKLAIIGFAIAEKLLPGKTGDEKFVWVRNWFLTKCPNALDPVAEAFLNFVYPMLSEHKDAITDAEIAATK